MTPTSNLPARGAHDRPARVCGEDEPVTDYPEARAILAEFGITPVPPSAHVRPGETKAVGSLQKIIIKRGRDHARFVIMTWKDTHIRRTPLDGATLWALSDTVILMERNFPEVVTKEVEDKWFRFIDGLPIGWLQEWARDVDPIIPRRFAIGGMIYERAKRIFGIRQPDLLDDRRVA